MLRIPVSVLTIAGIFALHCSNSVSTPYCVTAMDDGVSSTFSANFNCTQVSVSGSNHVFKSSNLPNYKSYYYGSSSELYEALPSGNTSAGTNKISSQNLKYTIPTTGTLGTGTLSGTQAGLVSIGITANGLAIFNNAANAPDTLSTEASTFDNYKGHPQNSGVYHHHTEPIKLTNNDSSLIGVALDGFLIYGRKCDKGTESTSDDITPASPTADLTGGLVSNIGVSSAPASATQLDELHGHTTVTRHLSTATYHYHVLTSDPIVSASGLQTIMGSYFRGVKGSVSN